MGNDFRGLPGFFSLRFFSLRSVDSFHVVPEIPAAWKASSRNSSLTTLIAAKEGLVAMSMHGMGFTLMAEQASVGGETKPLTGVDLALIWL